MQVAQVSQPAVSPISNRQDPENTRRAGKFARFAGWKHCDTAPKAFGVHRLGNLRYGATPPDGRYAFLRSIAAQICGTSSTKPFRSGSPDKAIGFSMISTFAPG